MIRRPPRSKRTDTLFAYTTLFRSIRANMVAPGIIDAGLGAAFLKDLYNPDIWETQRQRTALRRFGTGEEIAEAVRFLACDRASYITGQTLKIGRASCRESVCK